MHVSAYNPVLAALALCDATRGYGCICSHCVDCSQRLGLASPPELSRRRYGLNLLPLTLSLVFMTIS